MNDLLSITLEAHNDAKNHHRWYQIVVGRDLFDDWNVGVRYGRSGRRGQEQHFGGSDIELMRKVVRDHLRRRLSAPKRIGCSYQLTGLNVTTGFDASSWLAADVMTGFFRTMNNPQPHLPRPDVSDIGS